MMGPCRAQVMIISELFVKDWVTVKDSSVSLDSTTLGTFSFIDGLMCANHVEYVYIIFVIFLFVIFICT